MISNTNNGKITTKEEAREVLKELTIKTSTIEQFLRLMSLNIGGALVYSRNQGVFTSFLFDETKYDLEENEISFLHKNSHDKADFVNEFCLPIDMIAEISGSYDNNGKGYVCRLSIRTFEKCEKIEIVF